MSAVPWILLVASVVVVLIGAVGIRKAGPRLALIGAIYMFFSLWSLTRNSPGLSHVFLAATVATVVTVVVMSRMAWRSVTVELSLAIAVALSILGIEWLGEDSPELRLTLGSLAALFGVGFVVIVLVRGVGMLRSASNIHMTRR